MSAPAPFLPDSDPIAPPPAAPPKGRWKLTLGLWVGLIVLFLTIWQFLSPGDETAQPESPPTPTCTNDVFSSVLTFAVPFGVLLVVLLQVRRTLAGDIRFQSSQEPGLLALAEHRYADALASLEESAKRWKAKVGYRAVIGLKIGLTHLLSGRIDDALAAYIKVERETGVFFTSGARVLATVELAYVYALTGELDVAERWVAEARKRLVKTGDERIYLAGKLSLAEAVIACRRGAPRDAIALLDRNWNKLRFVFTADTMRTVEVIRAFAEAQDASIREQNVVAQRLHRIEPTVAGEFAYLGVKWPEMRHFLATHDLGPVRADGPFTAPVV